MSKRFNKGDLVTRIGAWNEARDFYFVQAVVVSCGAVQMVLEDADTGVTLGRHFSPNGRDSFVFDTGFLIAGTYEHMSDDQAIKTCNELSKVWKAARIAELADIQLETCSTFTRDRIAAELNVFLHFRVFADLKMGGRV